MSVLLRASNLSFAYGRVPALRDVNVTLAAGEIVALLGPNGSGKSTLLRLLLGYLHSSAIIDWETRPLRRWSRKELARRVAYLPQAPTHDPDHRVIDVLRLGRAPYWSAFGIESPQDAEVVTRIAQQLAIDDLLTRRMDELSGGQRQRVFLGRCLAQEPAAMLLDEPSTFLDLRHQVELLELLRKLARQQRIGVLMASHDLNLTAAFADRVILLDQGSVVAEGAPREVLGAETLARVYGLAVHVIDGGSAGAGAAPVIVPIVASAGTPIV
jgi:iron complex transport system ATP-binding protein